MYDSREATRSPSVCSSIVGIGASAGGLEALEQFLAAAPPDGGIAYVIVQHLAPDRRDMMVELLQHATELPVLEATSDTPVVADHVYVIPPGHDLLITDGILQLVDSLDRRGPRLTIDRFFESLSEDQGAAAVGVILSGTGSDGTLGMKAIKAQGGICLVQSPGSAQFDAMPRSVIDAGLADIVADPAELPAKILDRKHDVRSTDELPNEPPHDSADDEPDDERASLHRIVAVLRAHTGRDFSHYKLKTVQRRIARRVEQHKLSGFADYRRYLEENADEAFLLFKELLIGTTSFYRDPDVWEYVRDEIMPSLFAQRPEGGVLRSWVPGCSTGEEAFTLAMVFREALEQSRPDGDWSLQVFATDIDDEAVAQARSGIYPAAIENDITPERLDRFFVSDDQRYRIKSEIRDTLVFAQHDVVADPPFTNIDIVSCRNLLIYFDTVLQERALRMFHYALKPHGVLVLGTAESTGSAPRLFDSERASTRTYRRSVAANTDAPALPHAVSSNHDISYISDSSDAADTHPTGPKSVTLQQLVTDLVVREHSPATVLTNADGDILYLSSRTSAYLEPAVGRARMNVFDMARDGVAESLYEVFHAAYRTGDSMTAHGTTTSSGGIMTTVDVTVQPLHEPSKLKDLALIVFNDVQGPNGPASNEDDELSSSERTSTLARDLVACRERLRTTQDEMQASSEQLMSSNEEMQSANEELQSTNEELSTSKEELQSTNEELNTINNELQSKVNELSRVGDDLRNLFNGADVAILFLDAKLNVRRYTDRTASVIRLKTGDVGRPISDLTTDFDYPTLSSDAATVLKTLTPCETEVTSADKRWFTVRIIPYRTQDDRIDGVVITLSETTPSKRLELQLRAAQSELEDRFDDQTDQLAQLRGPDGAHPEPSTAPEVDGKS